MIKPFRDHHLLQAIQAYTDQTLPLDLYLNQYYRANKALGSKDRLFLNETIFTMIRWKGLLDAFSEPPHGWAETIKVFQSTTIDDLRSANFLSDHDKVSFPEWLYTRLKEQLGESKAKEVCLISNTQAPPTIRVNPLKSNRETLLTALQKHGKVTPTVHSPYGLVFLERMNYFEIPEFVAGHFEIQDEGSQLLADLICPKAQDHILDFCAGSGGKTLAFAHKTGGKGQIYLHDIRPKALQQAKKRLNKAGVQNAQIVPAGDPKLKKLKGKMDWVFVDAPCSGTGTLRRNPDMKWKLSEEMVTRLIGMQRSIFEQALSFLSPKGSIIYGTCSMLAEENEQQIEHFIKTYNLEVVGSPLKLLPEQNGADGFFGVVLKRRGNI
jgi:16S rRNA (cytosine(967)-C(5))-methyltransferase